MNPHERDQLHELLADAALDRLTPEQELELENALAEGAEGEKHSFEVTAACLNLCLLCTEDLKPMPASARARLEAAGRAWCASQAGTEPIQLRGYDAGDGKRRFVTWSPWLAAAAGVTLAVIAWSPHSSADPIKLVESDPNKVEVPFSAWSEPSDKACDDKCIGCICWSEDQQKGYLKLSNAFPCNDCNHQFQLWIIDERGAEERVSAGVFDCKTAVESKVAFSPSLPVRGAKSFAITMEKAGGAPVSKMTNKVAICHCNKKR